jgi:hypothetical protein
VTAPNENSPPELPEAVAFPPRSRLYSLEPQGLGGAWVESLTSYIARLAAAHSLRVSTLVREIIAPCARGGLSTIAAGYDLLRKGGNAVNGSGQISWHTIRIIEILTGRSGLGELTLQFTRGWLAMQPLMSKKQKWCAWCLETIRESGQTVYYPLLWHFESVTLCREHNVALESLCPKCSRSHAPLAGNLVIGYCPRCFTWLGSGSRNLPIQVGQSSGREKWAAIQAASLLENRNECPVEVDKSHWAENIAQLSRFPEIGSALGLAKALSVHHRTVLDWRSGRQLPSFLSLLLVGYHFDLNVPDLVNHRLLPENLRKLDQNLVDGFVRRPLQRRDLDLLHRKLCEAAESPRFPPLSLKQICAEIGYHQSYAARKFPTLAERIKEYWRQHEQIRKEQRQFFAWLVAKATASNLAAAGEYPSSRKMEEELPSSISLRDPHAKRGWKEALSEWGLKPFPI